MILSVNLVARSLGLAWVGVLTFAVFPPDRTAQLVVQAAGYGVAWLALGAWGLVEQSGRHRQALPAILGLLATASGVVTAAGISGGIFLLIFCCVAVMAAGGDLDLPPGLAVTAAAVLAIEVTGLVFGLDYRGLLGYPASLVGALLIGRNRAVFRVRAEQSAALLAQRELLEAEQRRADLLAERARIAREIHDVLAHSLGALSIQVQAARSVLTDHGDVGRAVELLADAQRMTAEGLTETRRAVHALRTDTLPLDEELARAASTYEQRYDVPVALDTAGPPRPVPPEATVALLRIAQESLVNAAKHAAGQTVAIRLEYAAEEVRLTVRNELGPHDQGSAGAPVRTADLGYGLTGMRERLAILGGTLEAGRTDSDWVVEAQVPWPA